MGGIHFGQGHTHDEPLPQPPPPGLLQRIPDHTKLLAAVLIVLVTTALPLRLYAWHLAVVALLILTCILGRISTRRFLLKLALFAPVIGGAALTARFNEPLGPGWAAVLVRGLLCLSTMLVLGSIVPFGALPGILRRARLPSLLVTTLTLLHRYLFVLGEEASRMRRARTSRSLKKDRTLRWTLPAGVIGRLFVRASERAERVYLAMCSRGWK